MGNLLAVTGERPRPWPMRGLVGVRRQQTSYEFRRILGAGTFGIAVLAADLSDPNDLREIVIKFQVVDETFREELAILRFIEERVQREAGPSSTAFPMTRLLDGFVVPVQQFLRFRWPIDESNKDVRNFVRRFLSFRSTDLGVLVLSYADRGDLANYLDETLLDPVPLVFTAFSLVLGLTFLHNAGVQHRDIDPSNVVMTSLSPLVAACNGDFRYAVTLEADAKERLQVGLSVPRADVMQASLPQYIDFGASTKGVVDGRGTINQAVTRINSRAPEVFYGVDEQTRTVTFDNRSDVWSLGIVLLRLGVGSQRLMDSIDLLSVDKRHEHSERLRNFCQRQDRSEAAERQSSPLTDFVCLDTATDVVNYFTLVVTLAGPPPPSIVAKLTRLLGDGFMALVADIATLLGRSSTRTSLFESSRVTRALGADGIELVRSLLKWTPDERPSAEQVLRHPYFASRLSTLKIAREVDLTGDDDEKKRLTGRKRKQPASPREVANIFAKNSHASLTRTTLPEHWVWYVTAATSNNAQRECASCARVFRTRESRYVCTGCEVRVYCGIECQRLDWCASHRLMCPHVRRAFE